MTDNDQILRGSVLERLNLAEHDAEERDWRSGANELARIRKYVEALPAVTVGVKPLADKDNKLAKLLWAQSHTKPWHKWERSSPEVRQSFIDGATRILAALQPAAPVQQTFRDAGPSERSVYDRTGLPPVTVAALEPVTVANCVICGRIVDTREKSDGGDGHGCEYPEGWTCSVDCAEKLHPDPEWMKAALDDLARLGQEFDAAPDPAAIREGDYFEGIEEGIKIGREAALREALEIAMACERQNYARVTDSEHHSHYRAGLRSAGQVIAAAIKSLIPKGAAE